MEIAPLTVEEKADFLWSEGWQLPDVLSCNWTRWVEHHYSLVTAGEERWTQHLRSVELYDDAKLAVRLAKHQRARAKRNRGT